MKIALRVNAVAVLALSGAYYWFFMFTKHSPPLAAILPFATPERKNMGTNTMLMQTVDTNAGTAI